MAVKLMEALRRRSAMVVATGALAGAALAVAGCGGSAETGSSASDVASFVPAGSPLYLEVTTDLDGPQWTQVDTLAKLFPAYPKLRAQLNEELAGDDVNFDRDVKPLLGDHAAIGALSVPTATDLGSSLTAPTPGAAQKAADDTEFVAAVDVAEGKEQDLIALLTKGGATKAGTHDGVDYYTQPDDDGVAAVDDGTFVFADTQQQLFQALDAHAAGGDKTLAGQSKFTDALAKLPADVFGQAYIDLGSLITSAGSDQPQLEQLGLGDYENAVVAASLAAEPDGVRLKGVVLNVPELGIGSFSPTLDDKVPADAVAYLGFNDLAGSLTSVLETARAAQDAGTQQQFDALAAQLPALLGVSLDDLKALGSGEHAVVVTGGARPGATVALQVEDGAKAQQTLDTLRVKVPDLVKTFSPSTTLPAWEQVPLAAGVQGWRLPLSPEAGVVYGVDGDLALIGTSVKSVAAVQRPASPLSASPAYQAGTSGMPDEVTSVLWVDVQQAIATADALGALDGSDAKADEILANLKPLKSVAAWTTGGDVPTFEVFARLAK